MMVTSLKLECKTPSRNPKINSSRDLFWAALFKSTFCSLSVLHLIDSGSHDDLLFFVRHTNSIFAKVVYASPSYRPMDSKGTQETIVYPHIVFPIDNFEEVFECCVLRDSECLCVELTAYDRSGALQGVLFEGVVRYSVLKSAHDVNQVNRAISSHLSLVECITLPKLTKGRATDRESSKRGLKPSPHGIFCVLANLDVAKLSSAMCSRGGWRFTPMKTVSGMLGGTLGDLYSYKGSPRAFVRMLARRSEGIAEVTIQQEPEATVPPNVSATSISRHHRRPSTVSNISIETDENVRPEEIFGSVTRETDGYFFKEVGDLLRQL
ncbi:hypothetical protein ACTXT7_010032 [Hymenolepis weldensis]